MEAINPSPIRPKTFRRFIFRRRVHSAALARTLKQGDTSLCSMAGRLRGARLDAGRSVFQRYALSFRCVAVVDGQRPLLLSSTVENDNVVLTVDLCNPDIYQGNALILPRESLHIRRSKFLWQALSRAHRHSQFRQPAAELLLTVSCAARIAKPIRLARLMSCQTDIAMIVWRPAITAYVRFWMSVRRPTGSADPRRAIDGSASNSAAGCRNAKMAMRS